MNPSMIACNISSVLHFNEFFIYDDALGDNIGAFELDLGDMGFEREGLLMLSSNSEPVPPKRKNQFLLKLLLKHFMGKNEPDTFASDLDCSKEAATESVGGFCASEDTGGNLSWEPF